MKAEGIFIDYYKRKPNWFPFCFFFIFFYLLFFIFIYNIYRSNFIFVIKELINSYAKNRYDSQIFRVDGKIVFLKFEFAFPIGKVQMNFVEYDEKTKKQTKKIELYVDVKRALVLANDIITGEFAEIVKKAKAEGKFNGSPVNSYTSYFIDMGGVNEEKVKSNLKSIQRNIHGLRKEWL